VQVKAGAKLPHSKWAQRPTTSSVAVPKISQIRPTHSLCSGFISTDRKTR